MIPVSIYQKQTENQDIKALKKEKSSHGLK